MGFNSAFKGLMGGKLLYMEEKLQTFTLDVALGTYLLPAK
jgi:hypothetical protein